ncbi:MAG: hypothetical protein ABIJ09_11105 [Pseudomonadota bacterium]
MNSRRHQTTLYTADGLVLCAILLAAPAWSQDAEPATTGGASPAQAVEETVEEEAVFDDEGTAQGQADPVPGKDSEEEVVFADDPAPVEAGPNAGFPENVTRPWLLVLPALGLVLIAGQVRWRGKVEEKR